MLRVMVLGSLLLAMCLVFGTAETSSHPGVALTSGKQGTASGGQRTLSIITAPMSVPANHLALIWVATTTGSAGPPTVSDPSRTWEMAITGGGSRRITLFKSLSPEPTTGTVVLTNSGGATTTWAWTAVEYPATQVVQADYSDWKEFNQNSAKAVLPSTTGTGFTTATFGVFKSVGLYLTPGENYQFVGGRPCTRMCLQAESRPDFAQVADMTWGNRACFNAPDPCHWLGIAVELQ